MNKYDFFDKCLDLINNIYVNIQQGREQNLMEKINELFMLFENIINENSNNVEYIEQLNKGLMLMESGMNNRDYFLMSDYLFYEIKPVIETWKNN